MEMDLITAAENLTLCLHNVPMGDGANAPLRTDRDMKHPKVPLQSPGKIVVENSLKKQISHMQNQSKYQQCR